MRNAKTLAALVVTLVLAIAACTPGSSADPAEVTFDVELVEIKGSTDGIQAPDVDPKSLSKGYGFTPPGEFDAENPDLWQVATYMFSPGAMSVIQGDDVTLRMFAVNGNEHVVTVQAPDGSNAVEAFTINRGREVIVNFTADQAGHYKIICVTHGPTMTADILSN